METNERNWERGRWHCSFWRCFGFGLLGVIGFAAFALLVGFVIMWLWNWLIPPMFHLAAITFWQAVGLAILARLLFGASHHGRHHWAHRRWKHHHGRGCGCGCNDHAHSHGDKQDGCHCDSDKWKYYDQYWEEEGEKSFDEYVKRKSESTDNS